MVVYATLAVCNGDRGVYSSVVLMSFMHFVPPLPARFFAYLPLVPIIAAATAAAGDATAGDRILRGVL